MPSSLGRRRVRHTAVENDMVIDLTDRLAPYHGSAVRPAKRPKPLPPGTQEPRLWTPLDLDFLHQNPRTPHE